MECINCGKRGHSFRECIEPITSFGIVALRFPKDSSIYKKDVLSHTFEHIGKTESDKVISHVKTTEKPEILMIRRKDSLGYVEFLRGKYNNIELIKRLIDGMTLDEKEKILKKDFDELWDELWSGQKNKQYVSEYDSAKRKFTGMKTEGFEEKSMYIMEILIKDSTTVYNEPEWGFPKGRRSVHESEFSAALREFREETGWGVYRKPPFCLRNIPCVIEKYTGSNGIEYRQIYYIGICNDDSFVYIDETNKVQTREVSKIGWFNFEEANKVIRDSNPEKKNILKQLEIRLNEIVKEYQERIKESTKEQIRKSGYTSGYYGKREEWYSSKSD
jgi:8-oxo-dGTP pyrophosphatase MutT (NUDIX family)